jgi:succinyl-CoA synthetase beta subunit
LLTLTHTKPNRQIQKTQTPKTQVKLVVKPDMLFGQRGKNDLVGLNLTFAEAEAFVRARMNKEVRSVPCGGFACRGLRAQGQTKPSLCCF